MSFKVNRIIFFSRVLADFFVSEYYNAVFFLHLLLSPYVFEFLFTSTPTMWFYLLFFGVDLHQSLRSDYEKLQENKFLMNTVPALTNRVEQIMDLAAGEDDEGLVAEEDEVVEGSPHHFPKGFLRLLPRRLWRLLQRRWRGLAIPSSCHQIRSSSRVLSRIAFTVTEDVM